MKNTDEPRNTTLRLRTLCTCFCLLFSTLNHAQPLIDLAGITEAELDPRLHCLDRKAGMVRRIQQAPLSMIDTANVPVSGSVASETDIAAQADITAGQANNHGEPGGLVWSIMKPVRALQERMREKSGRNPEQRDHTWGFHAHTRVKGQVHASGQLSLSSPSLARLPDCTGAASDLPEQPAVRTDLPEAPVEHPALKAGNQLKANAQVDAR